jgi:TolB-like protein/DNA-binding winged helix-turn-helix (wHTH) protein/Flp pilus assembly protein TadD
MRSDPHIVRFGVFEVDLQAGELRKSGARVKLQEKPFQVLSILLEHPGEVVTREELQQRLWPDVNVDFEHSLSTAIKKLRDSLDDSADTPRFVETRPGRGYRFIVPVSGRTGLPRALWFLASLALIVVLLAVLVGLNVAGLGDRLLGRARPSEIKAIAVLPLDNLSGDPEQDAFVDGMTEELITQLGKISALERVISRHSAMQYKGAGKPLSEIARELDVDALIEGSVLQSGDRVRINVQLIQAEPERHLWADSYERNLSDVLALHAEVARMVASEIELAVTPEDQARLTAVRQVNPAAFEAYVKGRYFWNQRNKESLEKGLEYFQQAIETDPSYAAAYNGVAESYLVLGGWALLPPDEAYTRAEAAARKALELDGSLADAHTSLANVMHEYDWDWEGAEEKYRRALELDPNASAAHKVYAEYLLHMGRLDEASAEAKRAWELDPHSLVLHVLTGLPHYYAGRYNRAIEQWQTVREMEPDFSLAHQCLGLAYEATGEYEEAIARFQEARGLSGDASPTVSALGHAYALSGARDKAEMILAELRSPPEDKYISAYSLAVVFVGLGEEEQALAWLDKAYEERARRLIQLKIDPRFAELRSHPRFQSLLRRLNFPE